MKKVLLLTMLALSPNAAFAKKWDFLIGPPSVGQGGSNPLSIPPFSPVDWQVTYINEDDREWSFSIVPGILYGQRWTHENLYMSLGGGLIVSTGGLGVGGYHALGMETEPFWKNFRCVFEYRQAAGIAADGPQFPYTVRIGVSYAP
jgi:hypothetical protein